MNWLNIFAFLCKHVNALKLVNIIFNMQKMFIDSYLKLQKIIIKIKVFLFAHQWFFVQFLKDISLYWKIFLFWGLKYDIGEKSEMNIAWENGSVCVGRHTYNT